MRLIYGPLLFPSLRLSVCAHVCVCVILCFSYTPLVDSRRNFETIKIAIIMKQVLLFSELYSYDRMLEWNTKSVICTLCFVE
jgi:hypothetical protein